MHEQALCLTPARGQDRGALDGRNPQSRWRTARGIQLGNTIRKVERVAGQPFDISICSCDIRGVTNTNELEALKGLHLWIAAPHADTVPLEDQLPKEKEGFILSSEIPNSMAQRFVVSAMAVIIDP